MVESFKSLVPLLDVLKGDALSLKTVSLLEWLVQVLSLEKARRFINFFKAHRWNCLGCWDDLVSGVVSYSNTNLRITTLAVVSDQTSNIGFVVEFYNCIDVFDRSGLIKISIILFKFLKNFKFFISKPNLVLTLSVWRIWVIFNQIIALWNWARVRTGESIYRPGDLFHNFYTILLRVVDLWLY